MFIYLTNYDTGSREAVNFNYIERFVECSGDDQRTWVEIKGRTVPVPYAITWKELKDAIDAYNQIVGKALLND